MRKIAIANNKGGVSKTTSAYNLGSFFARKGFKVLMVDCDPQGNLSDALGINSIGVDKTLFEVLRTGHSKDSLVTLPQYENFSLIVSNLETEEANMALSGKQAREFLLLNALEEIEDEFDICVIDTSPTLSLLTLNALVASDSIYIPLIAGFFELKGLGVLTNAIAEVNGNEMIDFLTEEDKAKAEKKAKKQEIKEEIKEVKENAKEKKEEIKENIKATKKEVKEAAKEVVEDVKDVMKDIKDMTLTELKEVAKIKGIKGYSKLKKDELLEVLK